MNMQSGLDGLKTLLGATSAPQIATSAAKSPQTAETKGLDSDRATFSRVGHEAAQSEVDGDIRADKVASVQASLAAGTYSVPASAVASKLVESMFGSEN